MRVFNAELRKSGYRQAQVAAGHDTVQSVLNPDLTFDAARIFAFP